MRSDLEKILYTEFERDILNTPNNAVPNGPVCGNGDIGVSMDLTERGARFWLGKNDFWCYRPAQLGGGMKSPAFLLITFGLTDDANTVLWQNAVSGHIGLRCRNNGFSAELEAFSPRGGSVVILRLKCLEGALRYHAQTDSLSADPFCSVRRESVSGVRLIEKSYRGDDVERPSCAATALASPDGTLQGKLNAGQCVTFAAALVTDNEAENPAEQAMAFCRRIGLPEITRLEEDNDRRWAEFWSASNVYLPGLPDVERAWYQSHYLMACCCDRDKFAPGIFGNFLSSDSPNWGGDYHLNYNHEAPFWGLYSSNHIEIADAYDRPVLEYVGKARQNAREQLGCRGLFSKVGIGPFGFEVSAMFDGEGKPDIFRPYWGQKSNASYAGINFILRYYHTLDRDYLEQKAYPYLRETMDFWEDYLLLEDGRYVDKNDYIHESGDPGPFAADREWKGNGKPPDTNPIVSLALIRTTLRALLDMSETLDRDVSRREKWKDMLSRLSGYTTQQREGRTVFRYTEKGMDWCDGNSLGIQPVYPAGDIGLDSDPALLRLARDTHAVMHRWEDYNAFPTFYTAAARLGCSPDEIIANMQTQLKTHGYRNGFIYYGGGGIECCSAVPSAVNDMLVQNYAGRLRLFPVWNREWDVSFERLRTFGALLVSAGLKDGRITHVRIVSEKGGRVCLVPPFPGEIKICCRGVPVETDFNEAGDVTFEAQAGAVYELG